MNSAKRFYERIYAEGRKGWGPTGLLGWLYTHLKKYELHRVDAAISLLDRGDKLLDLGCGDGMLLAKSKIQGKCNEVFGTDIAEVVVNRANKTLQRVLKEKRRFNFKVANLDERFPYKDGFFDSVTCLAVLEHIFDPYFTVSEISRVLKKGGVLVLEVPNLVWLPRRITVLFGGLPKTGDEDGWDSAHLHYFTFIEAIKLLNKYGLSVEYAGTTGVFASIRNIWPTLLGGDIIIKARKK